METHIVQHVEMDLTTRALALLVLMGIRYPRHPALTQGCLDASTTKVNINCRTVSLQRLRMIDMTMTNWVSGQSGMRFLEDEQEVG